VLYWARANRRVEANHALARAIELANEVHRPVLYYEELGCGSPYASDRLHTFLLEGVPEQARRLSARGIGYCFYLRPNAAAPGDVLDRLAADAACIVTDDYPSLAAAHHDACLPARLGLRYEVVDSSCIVPMTLLAKREYAAYTIRPKIQRLLREHLVACQVPEVGLRWSGAAPQWHTPVDAAAITTLVARCAVDHGVSPSLALTGGALAAECQLRHFLEQNLRRYARQRNQPAAHATSRMSAYLHFGHLSALQIALAVRQYAADHELIAEDYLEELIVRRELAFNYARHAFVDGGGCRLDQLPDWARRTLDKHRTDVRPHLYSRQQFEQAATHDALWNACQRELLLRGLIHGYYRMYWGKKIIAWSATPEQALATMIYLNDRYALDGRDPNTYSNILWCFFLHDRPWAERAVYGMVRYMSYDGMRRKTDIEAYRREIAHLERTGADPFRLAPAL
jgi:deoxyribodipyrimidine photo-lyase